MIGDVSRHRHWRFDRFLRTVRLGFKTLWLHRMRSLLTVLGIVFGVCSVIAMLAVGEGASFEAQEQIRKLGSNNIILKSIKPREDGSVSTERSYVLEYGVTYGDVERIRDTIPGVEIIVPGRIIRKHVWNGPHRVDAEIIGTAPWYQRMRRLAVMEGRFFTGLEEAQKGNVVVLNRIAEERLFPMGGALGRNVRIDSDYYKVVGVVSAEAENVSASVGGGSQPSGVLAKMYIPLSSARSRFGEVLMRRSSGSFEAERVELHEATVRVARQEDVEETALIIGEILASAHKKKDYEIVVPLELLRQAERTKQMFNIVLGAIAAISLVVGGIGIMNIMLASVTERTREIGIRRALGAKQRDIIVQFLIETVILSSTGGVIGVGVGVVIPLMITAFSEMRTIVTFWAPMIAFCISALVGIVFGIYPALRAAKMDPVEALRHE